MDEIDELLTWLLVNQLITMDQVRTWEAKAYLYANNPPRTLPPATL